MLTVRGRFEDGKIVPLEEIPIENACSVLITFLDESVTAVPASVYARAARELALEETSLTERECQVLRLLQRGMTNREIAIELDLSAGTIRNYTSSIYRKLGVRNRLEAVTRALDLGLLSVDDIGAIEAS